MENLEDCLKRLKENRAALAEVKEKARERAEAFFQTPQMVALENERLGLQHAIEHFEGLIKDIAQAEFLKSGNKKPHEKIQIKVYKVVNITDKYRARDWCIKNLTPALELNEKIFKDCATQTGWNVPADLVEIKEDPRVQIAKEL